MKASEITEENLTDDVVNRLLFEGLNDTGENADCIIVLGSIKAAQYRVPEAEHMRRSLHIARYLFPAHINIYPCPADDTTTRKDNWMHSMTGRERARAEVLNIVRCVNNGVFSDFKI